MEQCPSSEASCLQLVQQFSVLDGTWRFITAFKRATSCFCLEPDQSGARLIPLLEVTFNIIPPPALDLPSGLLSSGFPTKAPYALLLFYTHHMPRLSHFSWFDHSNDILWRVQIMKLLIMQSSPLPFYLFPFIPNVFLDTLFSHTLSPRSSVIWTPNLTPV
jgi:hypothetical protein